MEEPAGFSHISGRGYARLLAYILSLLLLSFTLLYIILPTHVSFPFALSSLIS